MKGNGIKITGLNGLSSIQRTIKDCLIRADMDNHEEGSVGIFLAEGIYDAMCSGNDIGFYKNGYGNHMTGHNGAVLSDNNAWQCKNGYNLDRCNRIRFSNCLSDYAQESGFNISDCTELQLSNCQSRWSGNKKGSVQTYDGIYIFDSNDFALTGCSVFAGDGSETVAEGTGQTAYAVSLANCRKGKISCNWLKIVWAMFIKENM